MTVMSKADIEELAKKAVDDEEYNLAIHLLETLRDNWAEEYEYDPSMGTLETPQPIQKGE